MTCLGACIILLQSTGFNLLLGHPFIHAVRNALVVEGQPEETVAVLEATLNDCTTTLKVLTLMYRLDGPMPYSLLGSRTGDSNENMIAIELTGLTQEQTYEYTVWVVNSSGQTIGRPVRGNFTTGLQQCCYDIQSIK